MSQELSLVERTISCVESRSVSNITEIGIARMHSVLPATMPALATLGAYASAYYVNVPSGVLSYCEVGNTRLYRAGMGERKRGSSTLLAALHESTGQGHRLTLLASLLNVVTSTTFSSPKRRHLWTSVAIHCSSAFLMPSSCLPIGGVPLAAAGPGGADCSECVLVELGVQMLKTPKLTVSSPFVAGGDNSGSYGLVGHLPCEWSFRANRI